MTWEQEYTEYFMVRAPQLRRLGYALCGDWHLAEDLVQGTFLQLYRHWRRLEQDSLDAYSRRALVNAFLSNRRTRRQERLVAQPPDFAGADATAALDTALGIRAALDALPPKQRALVVLRHLEDVSVAEAAELLGIAEAHSGSITAKLNIVQLGWIDGVVLMAGRRSKRREWESKRELLEGKDLVSALTYERASQDKKQQGQERR